jgi:uncharacterized protein (DUF486 family)
MGAIAKRRDRQRDFRRQRHGLRLSWREGGSTMTAVKTVSLLVLSNIFMTFAWYGHLKYKNSPLFAVIVISWGIAFFEYCLQVPANRIGSDVFSGPQLKLLQEAITLSVFAIFSLLYLKERPTFYDAVSFLLILLAVGFSVLQPRH